MKKLICLFFRMATFVAATFATPADSTKTDSVKGFSKKEYTVISDGDTTIVTPGDTTHNIQFTAADSVKATGKTDFQMINGKKTKIKEIEANGQKAWVKDDQDLSKPIEMWCDEDQDSDPIAGIWYGLISMLLVVSGFFTWRVLRR
jgi:hypothetical protein